MSPLKIIRQFRRNFDLFVKYDFKARWKSKLYCPGLRAIENFVFFDSSKLKIVVLFLSLKYSCFLIEYWGFSLYVDTLRVESTNNVSFSYEDVHDIRAFVDLRNKFIPLKIAKWLAFLIQKTKKLILCLVFLKDLAYFFDDLASHAQKAFLNALHLLLVNRSVKRLVLAVASMRGDLWFRGTWNRLNIARCAIWFLIEKYLRLFFAAGAMVRFIGWQQVQSSIQALLTKAMRWFSWLHYYILYINLIKFN